MAGKRQKPGASGLLGKITGAPGKAGAALAQYLLKGLYIPKKGKGAKGAKTVRPK